MTEPTYVEVVVNLPQVSGMFHYHLTEELAGQVKPGCLVVVPFGNRQVQGIVLRMVTEPHSTKTRPVEAVLDADPILTGTQMALGKWMAESTLSSIAACYSLMIPPGIGQQADVLFHLNKSQVDHTALGTVQKRLVQLLEQRGDLRGRQIDTALPRQSWRPAARSLARRGWLVARPVLQAPSVRPKVVRTAQLACSPQEAEAKIDNLGRAGSQAAERRQKIIRRLMQDSLPVQVSWIYAETGGNMQDLQKLEEAGLVRLGENETWRDPLENINSAASSALQLTEGQQNAWEPIRHGIQQTAQKETPPLPYLLHGITGSGKTEIYLRAVEETLRQGRQAIILVPEIALTPQTVRRFLSRFPGQIGLIHSRLSTGERYDTWRGACAGQLRVIVGPRSALFSPLPDPGLIVLDECHDPAYHQDDVQPTYNTVDAAIAYARLNRSVLVLGSATPDVGLYFRARQEGWNLLRLPLRILAHRQTVAGRLAGVEAPQPNHLHDSNLPPVKIIDMRQELKAGNRTIFSRELQNSLRQVLESRQQAILFLNRRGTATYVFCRDCGYALKCPRCDIPLTFHADQNGLVCHTCNYRRQSPKQCPQCASPHIRQFGTGTEKVESDIKALFPGARTLRWDAETTRQKGAHELILQAFLEHRADVLIGTQMLAKGLDLPLVTLVGVVLAEVGLQLPDYNAGERTFQLLTQVAGRAGRSLLGGKVIFQTFQPEHYAIRAAAQHDYAAFYRQEMEYRKRMQYPPFTRLVRLECRGANPDKAEADAKGMAAEVQRWIEEGGHRGTSIIGPVPCFFSRQNSLYRWQIILRGPNPADILRGKPLNEWRVEVDPTSLL
jgi:primosomal protein N' (replication factor Y) (superfamily II helicase)